MWPTYENKKEDCRLKASDLRGAKLAGIQVSPQIRIFLWVVRSHVLLIFFLLLPPPSSSLKSESSEEFDFSKSESDSLEVDVHELEPAWKALRLLLHLEASPMKAF